MRRPKSAIIAALALGLAGPAAAQIEYDQGVTPNAIFGTGNVNGFYTTDRSDGVELGLRGKLRHNAAGAPENTFNSNGDGSYSFAAGVAPTQSFPTAVWSFEWSINSDYQGSSGEVVGDYAYELGVDQDPSGGTNFLVFDPINDIEPIAGEICWDHSMGTNGTANDDGVAVAGCRSGDSGIKAAAVGQYAINLATYNVAQNSWKAHWVIPGFDPTVDGIYTFYLAAKDDVGNVVARTEIQVVVGAIDDCTIAPNPVPVNGTYQVLTSTGYDDRIAPTEAGIVPSDFPGCDSLIVYDPSAGFVTGGGWIMSPEGAMTLSGAVWDQDFSVDANGWFDSSNGWYGQITVDGGTALFEGGASGPFSGFDGYRDTWAGTWIAEIDVFLDPSWAAGQGFDYSVASSRSDGTHLRDFIFHVGTVEDYGPVVGKALLVNGSNNADFTTNPFKLVNDNSGNYYEVTTAGWYTLQHVFYDAGGYLAVDLNLLDSGGNLLWTATRATVADTIPGVVGGNRYGWFTHIDVASGITVDNHQLFLDSPSAEGKASFGFVSRYKKGASIPTGNTQFKFEAGGLNFHSSSYQWLVVNQGGTNAQYKGEGLVNGGFAPTGLPYNFMLWAGDGDAGGNPDTFRIKIGYDDAGEVVVYDNGMDQAIGGGQIIIHTGGKKK